MRGLQCCSILSQAVWTQLMEKGELRIAHDRAVESEHREATTSAGSEVEHLYSRGLFEWLFL